MSHQHSVTTCLFHKWLIFIFKLYFNKSGDLYIFTKGQVCRFHSCLLSYQPHPPKLAFMWPVPSRFCPGVVRQTAGLLLGAGSQILHVGSLPPRWWERRPSQGLDQQPVLHTDALPEPGQVQTADLAQQNSKHQEGRSEAQASGTLRTSCFFLFVFLFVLYFGDNFKIFDFDELSQLTDTHRTNGNIHSSCMYIFFFYIVI